VKKIRSTVVFLCLTLANVITTSCMEFAIVEARARYSELIDPIIAEAAPCGRTREAAQQLILDSSTESLMVGIRTTEPDAQKREILNYIYSSVLHRTFLDVTIMVSSSTIKIEEVIRLTLLCDFLRTNPRYRRVANRIRNVIIQCEKSGAKHVADNVFERESQKINPTIKETLRKDLVNIAQLFKPKIKKKAQPNFEGIAELFKEKP